MVYRTLSARKNRQDIIVRILTILGPNLNLLGWITRTTGQRLTLDKLERAVRAAANDLSVDLKIYQLDSEVTACKYVSRERNKCDGILLVPGIWSASGRQLLETLTIVGKPLGLYHLTPEGGPWSQSDPSIFSDIAQVESAGGDEGGVADHLRQFVTQLRG